MSLELPRVAVDRVGVDQRVADLARRSIQGDAKVEGLRRIITMTDLTTLEGTDTLDRVRALCQQARQPLPGCGEVPAVAAVCVYPSMVAEARRCLQGSGVRVASVATAFPSGQTPFDLRLEEVRRTLEAGAEEIDMVISRGLLLAGEEQRVHDEIAQVKEACQSVHLKVILECGELGSYQRVRRASDLALAAGADFIKTSTGKIAAAATPAISLVMMQALADHQHSHRRCAGLKVAGGVRTARQALHYLVLVRETLGEQWLTPARLRFGASSLLTDVLMQWRRLQEGTYTAQWDVPRG